MVTATDIGPTPSTFVGATPQRSGTGRILCLDASADGQRVYAGCFAGVWRSDDGGRNWRQMARPQPGTLDVDLPGALYAPYVIDIAVCPADANIVLAAAEGSVFSPTRNGIYRSTDGGESWTLTQSVIVGFSTLSISQVVFAPDDPSLVFAPMGRVIAVSNDAGATWTVQSIGVSGNAWHVAAGPLEPGGVRRVYAAGDNNVWRSIDGGLTWSLDLGVGVVRQSRALLSAFRISVDPTAGIGSFATRTGTAVSPGAQALAIAPDNPNHVFLATIGGTFGPSYYVKNPPGVPDGINCNTTPERLSNESSLWFADFTAFEPGRTAQWQAVPGPPVYWGGSTPSGKVFVSARPTPSGYLLFFSDLSHVHVSNGRPMRTSAWHRIDGRDVSVTERMGLNSNHLFVHADPHALVASPDFDIALKPAFGVGPPYDDVNCELDQSLGGTILMANDGGVQWSDDGGVTWHMAEGFHTCDAINIAGLAKPGEEPALYIGTGDNDSFFTRDGGQSWRDCAVHLGDADAWFADVSQTKVMQFGPRAGGMFVWTGNYPDASNFGNARKAPPPAVNNANSGCVEAGSSPLVRTLATEPHPADGDYVILADNSAGERVLYRTLKISTIDSPDDWEDPQKAGQIGPPVPFAATTVQASGGHLNPTFYVSNGMNATPGTFLSKLGPGDTQWREIAAAAGRSPRRFFVDPFNPEIVYLLDSSGMAVSLDGGDTWIDDTPFTAALTGNGKLAISSRFILTSMFFVRTERFTRFATGAAGVICTVNGIDWLPLHSAIAMPGLPESVFFDGIQDPLDRKLYVSFYGRSVMRLTGIPAPAWPPWQPGLPLMDLAALLHDA